MNKEKEQKLTALGFAWVTEETNQTQWESSFENLKVFKAKYGHCKVPQGSTLGNWVLRQRHLRKIGKLTEEKIQKLDSLNFLWVAAPIKTEQEVKQSLDNLEKFYEENGHTTLPHTHPLYNFVRNLKKRHDKGTLEQSTETRLSKIGIIWPKVEKDWDWKRNGRKMIDDESEEEISYKKKATKSRKKRKSYSSDDDEQWSR